jgi:hypothetical protein
MRSQMHLCRVSELHMVPARLAFNRCNYLSSEAPSDRAVIRLRRTQTRIDPTSKERLVDVLSDASSSSCRGTSNRPLRGGRGSLCRDKSEN